MVLVNLCYKKSTSLQYKLVFYTEKSNSRLHHLVHQYISLQVYKKCPFSARAEHGYLRSSAGITFLDEL